MTTPLPVKLSTMPARFDANRKNHAAKSRSKTTRQAHNNFKPSKGNIKMAKMPTHETYLAARKRRADIAPLHKGKYKLAEALSALQRFVATIELKMGIPTKLQRVCLDYESTLWVKTVPTLIADKLGYYVMPAVEALEGDGFTRKEVTSLTAECHEIITALLADAETVRRGIPSRGLPKQTLQDLLLVAEQAANSVSYITKRVTKD